MPTCSRQMLADCLKNPGGVFVYTDLYDVVVYIIAIADLVVSDSGTQIVFINCVAFSFKLCHCKSNGTLFCDHNCLV